MNKKRFKNWRWWVMIIPFAVVGTVLFLIGITGSILQWLGRHLEDFSFHSESDMADKIFKWVDDNERD